MRFIRTRAAAILPILAALTLSACGGSATNPSPPTSALPDSNNQTMALRSALPLVDTDIHANVAVTSDPVSVLKQLDNLRTIGSTVDAKDGDQNPYGLDVAKSTAGKIMAGDLVICNFNNAANVQGTGTTMEVLHPQIGSVPLRLAKHPALLGCAALALSPGDDAWAAAFASNENPIFGPAGKFFTGLTQYPWYRPWGQAYASKGPTGGPAFYESNAADGSLVRIDISAQGNFTFDRIASGFGINGGQPGSILAPSGLQYDPKLDRLYVIDGMTNTVVALNHVTTIPAGGIAVSADGKSFTGPFAKRGKLIWAGSPLNGPISSALLPNGNLVVGNTLDAAGTNLMVELSSSGGHELYARNVDSGAAGAIFGMVSTGTSDANTQLYFNDDNANAVEVLIH